MADLITVEKLKAYLHLTDEDISEDAISLYCSAGDSTAATVEVTVSDTYANTVSLVITGGGDAGTTTIDLSETDSDTISGVADTINDVSGWTAIAIGSGNPPASDLNLRAATACNGATNAVTLTVEDNYLLSLLIGYATRMINEELGYVVTSDTYTEYRDGDGKPDLWLENIPIIRTNMISISRNTAATVSFTGTAQRARVEVTNSTLRLTTVIDGTEATTELTLASYATFTALAVAIDAVSGWDGSVVSTFSNYDPVDCVKVPSRDANGVLVNLDIPEECEDSVEVYPENGRLYNPFIWDYGHNNIYVKYTAGYATVPPDIESACAELVKMLFDITQKDSSLRSEKIGDYSYTMADRLGAVFSSTGKEKVSNMVSMKLAPYKRTLIYGA